jgi:cobalt/nickel transport system permease protein
VCGPGGMGDPPGRDWFRGLRAACALSMMRRLRPGSCKRTNMHLPDGFLDAKTALLTTAAAATGVGLALREVRASLAPRQMPMLGLGAAFVFVAQMLNFPVAGGTSGHLVGGVLIAVLLGPGAAVLVMTCVLMVQCLMFADGGLLALGANVFNLGIVGACGGYLVFRAVKRLIRMEEQRSTVFAAAFAGWVSTVLASLACAGQLAWSGTAPWSLAFPAMANVHMLIGIGEGLATGLIVQAVLRVRPSLVDGSRESGATVRPRALGYGLLVTLGLGAFVAPFACPWPDGLERVARTLGFAGRATSLADYQLPFVGSASLATAVAGLIGTVAAFIAAYALARVVVPALNPPTKDAPSGN